VEQFLVVAFTEKRMRLRLSLTDSCHYDRYCVLAAGEGYRVAGDRGIAIKLSPFVEWIYECRCGFIRTVRQAAPAPKSYFLNLMAVGRSG